MTALRERGGGGVISPDLVPPAKTQYLNDRPKSRGGSPPAASSKIKKRPLRKMGIGNFAFIRNSLEELEYLIYGLRQYYDWQEEECIDFTLCILMHTTPQ